MDNINIFSESRSARKKRWKEAKSKKKMSYYNRRILLSNFMGV
jgi:hypothetical protein